MSIENNFIITNVYTKPTDRKQYINPKSCHSPHIFKSIPYSQDLRLKRICSKEEGVIAELQNLKGYFKYRGYPTDLIDSSFQRAMNPKPAIAETDDEVEQPPVVMVIPYHSNNPGFATCIAKLWQKYKQILNGKILKPIAAYIRPHNLKEILTKARYGPAAIDTPPSRFGNNVINRPINTYNMTEISKDPRSNTFYSNATTMKSYSNLEEAQHSIAWRNFQCDHSQCNACHLSLVQVKHKFNIKCSDCPFKQQIKSENLSTESRKKCYVLLTPHRKPSIRKRRSLQPALTIAPHV